jgi:hypothetical protein
MAPTPPSETSDLHNSYKRAAISSRYIVVVELTLSLCCRVKTREIVVNGNIVYLPCLEPSSLRLHDDSHLMQTNKRRSAEEERYHHPHGLALKI